MHNYILLERNKVNEHSIEVNNFPAVKASEEGMVYEHFVSPQTSDLWNKARSLPKNRETSREPEQNSLKRMQRFTTTTRYTNKQMNRVASKIFESLAPR